LQPQGLTDLGRDEEVPCFDPSCASEGGVGEPEQDGDHRYYTCNLCGNDFGYRRIETNILAEDADGNCSVGVPAAIRRAASAPMEHAHEHAQKPQPVSLGLTIGRRASD
jgi:hypothetical protein